MNPFTDRRVLIVACGDIALDWAMNLQSIAIRVTALQGGDRL